MPSLGLPIYGQQKTSGLETRRWRTLAEAEGGAAGQLAAPHGDAPPPEGYSRRGFMKRLGASAALAGTTTLSGCLRKEAEVIVPYTDRPEDLIPGAPRYYRTAMATGDSVVGLHVASIDGRPVLAVELRVGLLRGCGIQLRI